MTSSVGVPAIIGIAVFFCSVSELHYVDYLGQVFESTDPRQYFLAFIPGL